MQTLTEKNQTTAFGEFLLKRFFKILSQEFKNNPNQEFKAFKEQAEAFFNNSNVEEKIQALLITMGLTKPKKIKPLASNANQELYTSLAQALAKQFLTPNQDESELLETVEWFLTQLKKHIEEQTVMLDARNYHEDNPLVRRMDALARLLKLNDAITACIAVVLVNNTLYISLNNTSKMFKFDEVASTINQLLDLLIQSPVLIGQDKEITYEDFYNDYAETMLAQFPKGLPLSRLKQDIAKLVYSLHLNPDETPELNQLLSKDLQRVFLYPDKTEDALHYVVYDNSTKESQTFPILHAPQHIGKTNIHAEQILITYLVEQKEIDSPLNLGVSKLCCSTCYDFLSQYQQVQLRGTHNIVYDNTYNLKTNEVSKSDGVINRRPVHPTQSPTMSPVKKTNKIIRAGKENKSINHNGMESLSLSARCLFFKEPETEVAQEENLKKTLFSCSSSQ